jgi:hypothetical protein
MSSPPRTCLDATAEHLVCSGEATSTARCKQQVQLQNFLVVCTSCLQEPPPDSQPPGDESDRLLLDALKAAAPGTELGVDEDEPIVAAAPAEHAGGAAHGDTAAAAVVPQPEAVAGVRDAAGSAAEAASGGAAGAASVAVAPADAAADEPMPEAAAEAVLAVPAEPSLSEQTLIKKVTSPATVTGEQSKLSTISVCCWRQLHGVACWSL